MLAGRCLDGYCVNHILNKTQCGTCKLRVLAPVFHVCSPNWYFMCLFSVRHLLGIRIQGARHIRIIWVFITEVKMYVRRSILWSWIQWSWIQCMIRNPMYSRESKLMVRDPVYYDRSKGIVRNPNVWSGIQMYGQESNIWLGIQYMIRDRDPMYGLGSNVWSGIQCMVRNPMYDQGSNIRSEIQMHGWGFRDPMFFTVWNPNVYWSGIHDHGFNLMYVRRSLAFDFLRSRYIREPPKRRKKTYLRAKIIVRAERRR